MAFSQDDRQKAPIRSFVETYLHRVMEHSVPLIADRPQALHEVLQVCDEGIIPDRAVDRPINEIWVPVSQPMRDLRNGCLGSNGSISAPNT